jgi:hypothetical protein
MDPSIKIHYSVKGNNSPIQFKVPPNPWITTTDNGFTLLINRPGVYEIIADRSHVPAMFRQQLRLNIMDQAKNRIVAKGVHDKYLATILIDPTELGTPTSKVSAHITAPYIPPFNGILTIIHHPLPY